MKKNTLYISDIVPPMSAGAGSSLHLGPPSQSSQSQSGLSSNSCPVFIWPLWPNLMDSAPLSPAVTSHPGSPPSTGGLDPGWQLSTGEPFPYSLSITGDPPYLSLATNGTPVNTIDTLTKRVKQNAGSTDLHLATSSRPTIQSFTSLLSLAAGGCLQVVLKRSFKQRLTIHLYYYMVVTNIFLSITWCRLNVRHFERNYILFYHKSYIF